MLFGGLKLMGSDVVVVLDFDQTGTMFHTASYDKRTIANTENWIEEKNTWKDGVTDQDVRDNIKLGWAASIQLLLRRGVKVVIATYNKSASMIKEYLRCAGIKPEEIDQIQIINWSDPGLGKILVLVQAVLETPGIKALYYADDDLKECDSAKALTPWLASRGVQFIVHHVSQEPDDNKHLLNLLHLVYSISLERIENARPVNQKMTQHAFLQAIFSYQQLAFKQKDSSGLEGQLLEAATKFEDVQEVTPQQMEDAVKFIGDHREKFNSVAPLLFREGTGNKKWWPINFRKIEGTQSLYVFRFAITIPGTDRGPCMLAYHFPVPANFVLACHALQHSYKQSQHSVVQQQPRFSLTAPGLPEAKQINPGRTGQPPAFSLGSVPVVVARDGVSNKPKKQEKPKLSQLLRP